MGLKLYEDPKSPYWYVRGTIGGKRYCESTKVSDRETAEKFLQALESELYSKVVLLPKTNHLELGPEMRRYLNTIACRASNKNQTRYKGGPVSTKHVIGLYVKQYGRCAISGILFSLGELRHPYAPSLDRIDCSRGYSHDNIRLVCYAVNLAISNWGPEVIKTIGLGIAAKWQEHGMVIAAAEEERRKAPNVQTKQLLSA